MRSLIIALALAVFVGVVAASVPMLRNSGPIRIGDAGVDNSNFLKGCKPKFDGASQIETLGHAQVNAAMVVDYGTCDPSGHQGYGFKWSVCWGDHHTDSGKDTKLGPFQAVHTYHSCGTYTVTAKYCSSPKFPRLPACDTFTKQVTISSADGSC